MFIEGSCLCENGRENMIVLVVINLSFFDIDLLYP